MTTKHTPTPWRVDPDYAENIQTVDGSLEIAMAHDARGGVRVPFGISAPDGETCAANAAFIVRAVNHHEALVGALRALTKEISDDEVNDMVVFGDAHKRARALLAALDADNA